MGAKKPVSASLLSTDSPQFLQQPEWGKHVQRQNHFYPAGATSFNSAWFRNPSKVTIALFKRVKIERKEGMAFLVGYLEKLFLFSPLLVTVGSFPSLSFLGLLSHIYNPSGGCR